MSNSPLITYTKISPNRTSPRNHEIDTISIHCTAGQGTAKSIVNLSHIANYDARNGVSCNYAIGCDGSIALCVEEKDRSWCTSSRSNDHRAITIEVSSDRQPPYAVTDSAYKSLINLLVDICMRNPGIKKLRWQGDPNLIGQVDKQNMTVHKWFAPKDCPGEYLYSRHDKIVAEVNERLGYLEVKPQRPTETKTEEVCEVELPILKKGSDNGYVKTVQILLNKYNNARLVEDGIFGTGTHNAVVTYQKSRKLDADGIVGPKTWAFLLK